MKFCGACKVEMRCDKNDVPVELVASFGSYQLWNADRWKCPQCGQTVLLTGDLQHPVAEHFEDGYDETAGYHGQRPEFVQVRV